MPVLGLGVDLVNARRVERLIGRNEDIFRERILGPLERSEISATAGKQQRVMAYATCIAAKEAFLKALGTGLEPGMRWPDIEISQRKLHLCGQAARKLAGMEADGLQLSFSSVRHSHDAHVVAIVVITRNQAQEVLL